MGKEFKEKNKLLSQVSKVFDENPVASLVNKYVEGMLLQQDMDLYVTEDDHTKEMLRLYKKLEFDYNVIYENIDKILDRYDVALNKIAEEL